MKILHLPWNVGGHSAALARAERGIGLDSRSVALLPARYGEPADETVLERASSALAAARARSELLLRALREADVVHYTWGEALFSPPPPGLWTGLQGPIRSRLAVYLTAQSRRLTPFRDLKALRKAGKIIAVTFMGDDIRQGDRQLERFEHSLAHAVPENYAVQGLDEWKRRQIKAFCQHADIIQALNPDLLHDLPAQARFMPYVIHADPGPVRSGGRPVIVHAPSDRRVKGTDEILAAIDAVRRNGGPDFEFDLVENVSGGDARARYARADLVIDQLHAGFYGTLGAEAMALGKPVIAYIRTGDLHFLPPAMANSLPVVSARPDSLTGVLSALLKEGRIGLSRRGEASRQFAEKWHKPVVVARAMGDLYNEAFQRRRRPNASP